MNGIVISIAGLGLVIFIHELGHFLAAKAIGVKVYEFMLGLPIGPKLLSVKRGETTYGVSAFLLGGYVRPAEVLGLLPLKIEAVSAGSEAEAAGFQSDDLILKLGEDEAKNWSQVRAYLAGGGGSLVISRDDESHAIDVPAAGVRSGLALDGYGLDISEIDRTVEARPSWQKVLLVAAGPLMNFVLAYVLIVVILLAGFPGRPSTELSAVVPGSPAAKVGVRPGDTVVEIAGKRLKSWADLRRIVAAHRGRVVDLKVVRGDKTLSLRAKLGSDPEKGMLGVVAGNEPTPMAPVEAAVEGGRATWGIAGAVIDMLKSLVSTPGKVVGNLRSPVGAVVETAPIAERDMFAYIAILAQLSIGIGILNLLPIPPLDGGRVVVSIFEGVFRRPIPKQILAAANLLGISILLLLMSYLIVGDIFRLATGGGG